MLCAAVIGLGAVVPATALMAGGDESGMWAAIRGSASVGKPAGRSASSTAIAYAPQAQNRLTMFRFERRETLRLVLRKPRQDVAASSAAESGPKERIICTRLCDGDELVLGFKGESATDNELASMCDAAGGAAQTALFSSALGGTSVKLEYLRGREPGTTYPAMADFLAGEKSRGAGQACTPGMAERPMSVPIGADATLEKGDIVATSNGFEVFVGDAGTRHEADHFVQIDRARGVSKDVRRLVQKLASNRDIVR